MARSEKNVTLARRASFEVAHLGRKGEAFWPKAYPHRSLGNRPRKMGATVISLAEGHIHRRGDAGNLR